MSWPRDRTKLDRVRRLMEQEDLDALVVRASDNLLYLSNFWTMKGYDIVVFPREGEMTLCLMDPGVEEARRCAWTDDLRSFRFYDDRDPRPPLSRSIDQALDVLRTRGLTGRVGIELSLSSQASDRMMGEPTVAGVPFFEAFSEIVDEAVDCVPLLSAARAIKTEQEIDRMRLANEIAGSATLEVRQKVEAGMSETEVATLFEGFVHRVGTGFKDKVQLARGFCLASSGPGIRPFTPTSARRIGANEPTLLEIWVCADGYWTDLTKSLCPAELSPKYDRLLDDLLVVFDSVIATCRPGVSMSELDLTIRSGLAAAGHAGQPPHPVAHGVGARAHEPPWPHQAGSGTIEEGMVFALEPGVYWPEGGGLRLEDNFLVTSDGAEKLGTAPDDFR
jgi:Xaa-Pro dipeptidase